MHYENDIFDIAFSNYKKERKVSFGNVNSLSDEQVSIQSTNPFVLKYAKKDAGVQTISLEDERKIQQEKLKKKLVLNLDCLLEAERDIRYSSSRRNDSKNRTLDVKRNDTLEYQSTLEALP